MDGVDGLENGLRKVETADGPVRVVVDDGPAPQVALEPCGFFNTVSATLAGTLENTIGLEDASAFVGVVGDQMGEDISRQYARAEGGDLSQAPEALARILVDLKARLGGTFEIESYDDSEIVLVNGRCPFGTQVFGRSSLCMMTTMVFGRVVADRNGYASVKIEESLAMANDRCRVRVRLVDDREGDGVEFFR
ncbi:methanogen output domain 1-containing protein [Roseovarius sp. SK2]|uniref:methanogen output domain 1-containing protein n=1 Tax=Roseovarius TaxID=74030 RepID=UPI00237C141D|nr:methanogen output domain 1-containing protein [Roseovarius sp. SK2]MDD9725612.1 methanogen output domain 1-containing protein [Roseovarius sp. SK2]